MVKVDGRKIRELRKQKEWTQEDLGKKAVVTQMMIHGIEVEAKKPSAETLKRIADALGVLADDLYKKEPA